MFDWFSVLFQRILRHGGVKFIALLRKKSGVLSITNGISWIFRSRVEDRWKWIHIAWISIIYCTEGVPCTLSCERSLIWACEKGPIAWWGIWNPFSNAAGRSFVSDVSLSKNVMRDVHKLTALSAMSWFRRLLRLYWVVLWTVGNLSVHSLPSKCNFRARTRPKRCWTIKSRRKHRLISTWAENCDDEWRHPKVI